MLNQNNEIKVVIDGDNGVKVEDCMFISRAIEGNLDRDEVDFSWRKTLRAIHGRPLYLCY